MIQTVKKLKACVQVFAKYIKKTELLPEIKAKYFQCVDLSHLGKKSQTPFEVFLNQDEKKLLYASDSTSNLKFSFKRMQSYISRNVLN